MSNYKLWAPACSLPGCTKQVGYHSRTQHVDGTPIYDWKVFCEPHRTSWQAAADMFKLESGCANRTGQYGFTCTTTIEHSAMLDLHHKDGDRTNNVPENIECLCACCHRLVTLMNKDHLNRPIKNSVLLPAELWETE